MKLLKLLPLLVVFIACNRANPIPDYPVYLRFNITVDAPQLAAFGGFKEFTSPRNATEKLGFAGVLVYHSIEDRFYAFDMACPYENNTDTQIHCNNLGIAVCDSCQSSFYIADGNGFVQSGVAKHSLKKYTVYYDMSIGNIIVTN